MLFNYTNRATLHPAETYLAVVKRQAAQAQPGTVNCRSGWVFKIRTQLRVGLYSQTASLILSQLRSRRASGN
jgi:hypothetical protein